MGLSVTINPDRFRHDFEEGIGYVGVVLLDKGWEKVSLQVRGKDGQLLCVEDTKWVSQKGLLSGRKLRKEIKKAEKRAHEKLELEYRRKIYFCSVFDERRE